MLPENLIYIIITSQLVGGDAYLVDNLEFWSIPPLSFLWLNKYSQMIPLIYGTDFNYYHHVPTAHL